MSIIKKHDCLKESLASIYIEQTLKGLHYLHSEGIIHRDIKGANILVTPEGLINEIKF
eukprot:EC820712.1.p1 GENE.EC820712.1~~EC820712.1.p1  ORF type:complete len:58 (+),score=18.76 EC820712.1:163-336(+)